MNIDEIIYIVDTVYIIEVTVIGPQGLFISFSDIPEMHKEWCSNPCVVFICLEKDDLPAKEQGRGCKGHMVYRQGRAKLKWCRLDDPQRSLPTPTIL